MAARYAKDVPRVTVSDGTLVARREAVRRRYREVLTRNVVANSRRGYPEVNTGRIVDAASIPVSITGTRAAESSVPGSVDTRVTVRS